MRSQISDHLMADRCYFTLTEKASVNKHQMSSNMKSTPWIPCPINQVFLSRSTVVCFGQCAKQECLLSVDYNVMQTKPQTSSIKALNLLNLLLNQWSVACKSRATHLGLETLENRCHHLPDFLCTDKKNCLSTVVFAHTPPVYQSQCGTNIRKSTLMDSHHSFPHIARVLPVSYVVMGCEY